MRGLVTATNRINGPLDNIMQDTFNDVKSVFMRKDLQIELG